MPDERDAPNAIGLHLGRTVARRSLTHDDADRMRQLLDRFLPVNLRATVVPLSGEFAEEDS
ncbi:hypothetical protein [Streptomyces sp. NBC_01445]|uniref:hypothetical protein n=1 Tax=Streptomyces sp. NBC_01445 TaxID=2903869 RepID=UPI002DD89F2B|nr:hypothetical protein [Streptomyces sp. NBC_01445]WSE03769.1 hypothetical protein OG574_10555 [Streptomyces sp. NBC_01445]